jgi:hypothetical protein
MEGGKLTSMNMERRCCCDSMDILKPLRPLVAVADAARWSQFNVLFDQTI